MELTQIGGRVEKKLTPRAWIVVERRFFEAAKIDDRHVTTQISTWTRRPSAHLDVAEAWLEQNEPHVVSGRLPRASDHSDTVEQQKCVDRSALALDLWIFSCLRISFPFLLIPVRIFRSFSGSQDSLIISRSFCSA